MISHFHTAEAKSGRLPLHLRCHSLPKTLLDDYTLVGHVLGNGMSGEVKLAFRNNRPDKHVAVKSLRATPQNGLTMARISSEILIYLCMDHPHVTQLLDVYETQHSGFDIVMENMGGGSLGKRAGLLGKKMEERQIADLARQMLLAVSYIHSQDIVHRDLKVDNFLFDAQGSWHLKLADFGLSYFSKGDAGRSSLCGTAGYLAPEVLERKYDSKCDMWSLGVIIFFLLSGGSMPFGLRENATAQLEEIEEIGYVLDQECWMDISMEAISFMQSLLERDPVRRLTAHDALNHPWITKAGPGLTVLDSTLRAFRIFGRQSSLHRLGYIAVALSLSCKVELSLSLSNFEEFIALDQDKDGVVRLAEIEELLISRLRMTADEAASVTQALNVSRSGNLHYSIFKAALLFADLDNVPGVFVQEAFQRFDKSGSGYIVADDLEYFAASCSGEDVPAKIRRLSNAGDSSIRYPEFSMMLGLYDSEYESSVTKDSLWPLKENETRSLGVCNCRYWVNTFSRCSRTK